MTVWTVCGFVGPGDTCTYAKGHTGNHSWGPTEAARSAPQPRTTAGRELLAVLPIVPTGPDTLRDRVLAIEAEAAQRPEQPRREPTPTDPATNYAQGWTDGWDAHKAEQRGGLDVERLWFVLSGFGVIENGTWVSFQREDAEKIGAQYNGLPGDPGPYHVLQPHTASQSALCRRIHPAMTHDSWQEMADRAAGNPPPHSKPGNGPGGANESRLASPQPSVPPDSEAVKDAVALTRVAMAALSPPQAVDWYDWAGEERTGSHVDDKGELVPFESSVPPADPPDLAIHTAECQWAQYRGPHVCICGASHRAHPPAESRDRATPSGEAEALLDALMALDYRMVEWWAADGKTYSLVQVISRSKAASILQAQAAPSEGAADG